MKTSVLTFNALLLTGLIACNSSEKKTVVVNSDTTTVTQPAVVVETPPPPPMDSAEMQKAWMAYMTPGDIHKMFAESDGEWMEEVTMWMAPDAPPQTSKSTAINKMILGGRYQHSVHKGNFEGMPFEGVSTMGYDNATKKFVSTWIDNMGTGMMFMEGTMDPQTQVVNMTGKSTDPTTGKELMMRETFKIIDKNNQVSEMYCTKDGKEFKTMEIKFTRKNKKA